jgi:thymidylate synthase ThyX
MTGRHPRRHDARVSDVLIREPRTRVVFLPPVQAEKQAYALARYSRSGDPVEDSLAWVDTHSEEKFWKSFYFDYGHASIADLGHVACCFEDVSELAALEILDEPLWDGQARSTRYQDFATKGLIVPEELRGHPLEAPYRDLVRGLVDAYQDVHVASVAWLSQHHPRPDDVNPKTYERNIAARAFDMARYLLPLSIPTSVGQVTSIRTVEKQISRLLVSDLAEVRELASRLVEGCSAEPVGGGKPPAPTLARHAHPATWQREVRERARVASARLFDGADPPRAAGTTLHEAPAPAVELLAGLVYESARQPWARVVARVQALEKGERTAVIAEVLAGRGAFDELPRAARVGLRFAFEITMDLGGWRDMHRHRRCHQFLQDIDPDAGAEMPPDAEAAGILDRCAREHERATALARSIARACGPRVAAYALPLMHRVRSVFKMDFAEADYIARLRSGVKGHPSYRRVAWDMHEALRRAEPELAGLLAATPPHVQDPLTR